MLNSLKTFFFIKKAMEFDKFPIKIIVLLYISEKTIGNGVGQRR
jgi:hypothetical protein